MSSNRYRTVVAMLDDPLNRIAVRRELARRGKDKILPPPVVVLDREGKKCGWAFPTLRQVLQEGAPAAYSVDALQILDREVDVYLINEQWFVTLLSDGDTEMGPFDHPGEALDQAREWLIEQGFEFLVEVPWDEDDLKAYPLKF